MFEALRTDPIGAVAAEGRTLRFLANVDPVDVARATNGALPSKIPFFLSLLSCYNGSKQVFLFMSRHPNPIL